MQTSTVIAIARGAVLGPAIWWLLHVAGEKVPRHCCGAKLPEGRLRRVLLKDDGGKWVSPPKTPFDGLR
jgi:hypothetical protein